MDQLFINALVRLQMLKNRFFEEERGAEAIVTIVVLIGVAVLLAILFRNQISSLIDNLFKQIGTNANTALDGGNVT